MPLFRAQKVPARSTGGFRVDVARDLCKACAFCIQICPTDVFSWENEVNAIGWFPVGVAHAENCVGCMLCFQVCPDFCIGVEPVGSGQSAVGQR